MKKLLICMALMFSGAAQAENIGRQAIYEHLSAFDPAYATRTTAVYVASLAFEPLLTCPSSQELLPAQAVSWTLSEDKKNYTFTLRNDARWNDGVPVTAHDFVTAFQRILTKTEGDPKISYMLTNVENATEIVAGVLPPEALGVHARDDKTLVIRISAPLSYFPQMLCYEGLAPVPRHEIAEHGEAWDDQVPLVSNGPMVLHKREGNHLLLKRRADHWFQHDFSGFEFVTVASPGEALHRLVSGKIDIAADVSASQTPWLIDRDHFRMLNVPREGLYYLSLNTKGGTKLDDARVRRALSMAVDRELISETFGSNTATTFSHSLMLPKDPETWPDWMHKPMPERITMAKQLLAEAGVTAERPLEVNLMTYDRADRVPVANAIVTMWRNVGIEAELDLRPRKEYSGKLNARDYQVAILNWLPDFGDPMTFLGLLQKDSPKNRPQWANPVYNSLLEQALVTADKTKRIDIYRQMEDLIFDEVPVIPVSEHAQRYFLSADIDLSAEKTPISKLKPRYYRVRRSH